MSAQIFNWFSGLFVGPGIDTPARIISVVSLLLAFATFTFGRLDKRYERQIAKASRLPIIDLTLDKTRAPSMTWTVEFTFKNRAEVDFNVAAISVVRPLNLNLYLLKRSPNGRYVRNERSGARRIEPAMKIVAAADEEEWSGILATPNDMPLNLNDDLEVLVEIVFKDTQQTRETIKINRPLWPIDSH